MTNRSFVLISALFVFAFFAETVSAQSKQRVRFAPGTSSAIFKGSVRGFVYKDYLVRAAAGQTMTVRVSGSNASTVFTVFEPSGEDLEGASMADEFSGSLSDNGDYIVRVGIMRSAARRSGSVSNYVLKISID